MNTKMNVHSQIILLTKAIGRYVSKVINQKANKQIVLSASLTHRCQRQARRGTLLYHTNTFLINICDFK